MPPKRPSRLTAVVAGLVLSLLSTTSYPEPLSLVTGNDYLPYSDEELPKGGLATKIVLEIFRHAEIDHDAPDFRPWARGMAETKSTNYDATFPYARTSEREEVLLYSAPFLSVTDTFFVHGDFPDQTQTPADLEDTRVCRPLGYSQTVLQELQQTLSFDIETPQGATQCLFMLARGRVDFFFINELAGWHAIDLQQEHSENELHSVRMPDQIGKVELYLVMSRDNTRAEAVIEAFNASLQEMKESGEIETIVDEYLPSNAEHL